MGNTALGGLGAVGNFLDKSFGGRAIRGVLGGKPEEALSIIPGSDTFGLTDRKNIVSGRDLLSNAGVLDKGDQSWGGFGAGMAAEMALDPAMYLTLGGKTLLGQAAQKAGALPKGIAPAASVTRGGFKPALEQAKSLFSPSTISPYSSDLAAQMKGVAAGTPEAAAIAQKAGVSAADVADKPLSALATFKLPFTSDPFLTLGTGAGAQNFANKLGGIGDSLRFSQPGRAVAPLFDKRMSEFGPSPTTEAGQRVARAGANELAPKNTELLGQFLKERPIGEKLGMTDPAQAAAANREFLRIMEAPAGSPALPSRIPAFNDPAVQTMMGDYRTGLNANRPAAAAVGRKAPTFQSTYDNQYFPRQLTPEGAAAVERTQGGGSKFLSSRNPNDLARIKEFDMPGGTNAVNDVHVDPRAMVSPVAGVGQRLPKAAANIRETYFGWTLAEEAQHAALSRQQRLGQIAPGTPAYQQWEKMQAIHDQSKFLAKTASDDIGEQFTKAVAGGKAPAVAWSELVAAKKQPFLNNPLGEMLNYRQLDERSNAMARGFSDLAAAKAGATAGPGTVDLGTVLNQGTWGNANMKNVMLQRMQAQGLLPPTATVADLKSVHIPAAEAQDALRFGEQFKVPREINPLLKAWDTVTNATKAAQTTMLPITFPTIFRNAATEGFTNLMGGAKLGTAAEIQALRGGKDLSSLSHLPGWQNMTPAQQTARFNELAWQHGIDIPADKLAAMEMVGKGSHASAATGAGPGVLASIGGPQKGFGEMLQGAIPKSLNEANPLNVKGIGNAAETTFAPVRAGQELMGGIDDIGRRSAFLSYLQQGFEPAEAAAKAKVMRLSPGATTGFESEVMRRVVPYYNWLRTSVPGMAGELAQRPGGLVGQSIRASNDLHQDSGFVPDNVASGLAIPLGKQEDGTQRYLSGFGLPYEELQKLGSLRSMAGNLNPLLKVPIELATGTQLYSGRNLDDMYQRVPGAGVTGNEIISNSPLGPISRMASIMADPRKGVIGRAAALSPIRLTDVSPDQAMSQQRALLEQELRSNPNVGSFERLFASPESQANMSPEELQLLRMYQGLLARQRTQSQNFPSR